MTHRATCVATLMLLAACSALSAAPHSRHLAALVVRYGDEVYDRREQQTRYDEATHLVRDAAGRLNLVETSLNYAAALLATGENPERARRVIEAVLQRQVIDESSPRLGLFPWYAEEGAEADADATMYIAPTLAHLAMTYEGDATVRRLLAERAELALQGLLGAEGRPEEGFGLAMWAGAVASLGAAANDGEARAAAAEAVRRGLALVRSEGPGGVHSPTYDALRLGGLRWAWQFAADEQVRTECELALRLWYLDMLQRYEPTSAILAGAIGRSYAADYLGDSGVARYLLACDLPSAMAATGSAGPLAMYFALCDYALPEDLVAMGESSAVVQMRTRVPSGEEDVLEEAGTCTWVAPGMSLGTMSGVAEASSIPILATCDLPLRPTSYFYVLGAPATVQSVQTGPLALCSFNFDAVGVGRRTQVGVRGILGRRDQIERAVVGRHEWIGEPEAVGQNSVVAVRRGSSYVGVKILEVAMGAEMRSGVKPASLEWLREGNMDSLMLQVYGREAQYHPPKPLYDVRVGLLVEVAAVSEHESLEAFAEHVGQWKVRQRIEKQRVRVEREQRRQIPGRHELKTLKEMRFLDLLYHSMMLADESLPLGLTEELVRNVLISRTVPAELPEDYLWVSPELTLTAGGELSEAEQTPAAQ
ncbi:MAG: hypothetical protein ACP5KN_02945 [Armatimonadota bacterium]